MGVAIIPTIPHIEYELAGRISAFGMVRETDYQSIKAPLAIILTAPVVGRPTFTRTLAATMILGSLRVRIPGTQLSPLDKTLSGSYSCHH